jgi:predicted ATPase
MLEWLRLQNFKSAKDLSLRMAPLTVLSGLNGSGKSTVLQSLALLRQSIITAPNLRLMLRGAVVNLGRSEDICFEGVVDAELAFSLRTSSRSVRLSCLALKGSDTLPLTVEGSLCASEIEEIFKHFQFIQADRLTPATQYQQASTPDREAGWLGCKGEYTVDFLSLQEFLEVSHARHFPTDAAGVSNALFKQVAPTDRLIDQVAGWLQHLSPGVRPRSTLLDIADATSLRFEYTSTAVDDIAHSYRPTNVGFGLTYCLPVIVACLAAPQGSLLLLENPEAHLHPQGQAALGCLLARTAADGVQIIVETHSDHVLNGIRLEVKRKHISPGDLVLHYFSRCVESGESSTVSPNVLPDGQLDSWPEGFFDQWDRSLDALLD